MARLDYIRHEFYDASLSEGGELVWTYQTEKKPIERLPQIYWKDNSGWDEVNVWAVERAASSAIDDETVKRTMKHLHEFANFLEAKGIDWRHFPLRREDQVLRRFRKHLIEEREKSLLAPSTVTNCMNTVIQFYRFAEIHKLVGNDAPMWTNRLAVIPFHDSVGFKRTMVRVSSDLAIPNRKPIGNRLEDGLLPIRSEHMRELLAYTAEHETEELHLMLSTGFFSGPRVGTITTMTVTSLEIAREDPETPGVFLLRVGPGTGIATKFSVSGELMFPEEVLAELKRYALSTTRLLREAKAMPQHKNLLFLSRSSNPYSVATVDRLIQEMRVRAVAAGLRFMKDFTFHQSRATFGTWLMQLLLENRCPVTEAIRIVRDAMLHKDETTTLKYIKFLENTRAKKHAAAAFNEAFTGLKSRNYNNKKA